MQLTIWFDQSKACIQHLDRKCRLFDCCRKQNKSNKGINHREIYLSELELANSNMNVSFSTWFLVVLPRPTTAVKSEHCHGQLLVVPHKNTPVITALTQPWTHPLEFGSQAELYMMSWSSYLGTATEYDNIQSSHLSGNRNQICSRY